LRNVKLTCPFLHMVEQGWLLPIAESGRKGCLQPDFHWFDKSAASVAAVAAAAAFCCSCSCCTDHCFCLLLAQGVSKCAS